jgi:hypothetical protein
MLHEHIQKNDAATQDIGLTIASKMKNTPIGLGDFRNPLSSLSYTSQ